MDIKMKFEVRMTEKWFKGGASKEEYEKTIGKLNDYELRIAKISEDLNRGKMYSALISRKRFSSAGSKSSGWSIYSESLWCSWKGNS